MIISARAVCKHVSFAFFHPNLPFIVGGSENETVKNWNSGAYRIENTLSYVLDCAWCVADANEVVGIDEGVVGEVCIFFKSNSPKLIIPV